MSLIESMAKVAHEDAKGLPAEMREPRVREQFSLELAEALHAYGAPTHRLEDAVCRVGVALELELAILATPTSLQVAFGRLGDQRVHLLRAEAETMDLGRLSELDELVIAIEGGRLAAPTALQRIRELRRRPPRYPQWVQRLGWALASASAAPLFGGGWIDAALAAGLGASLEIMSRALGRRRGSNGLFEPLAAFWAGLVAFMAGALIPAASAEAIVLSGVVVLLPGLRLTVGITELATGHVVAGTARLASAASVMVLMLLGIVSGRGVASSFIDLPAPSVVAAEPGLAFALALALAPVAFVILFAARPGELPWIWVGGVGAVLVASSLGATFGPELASFAGAAFIALLSNELDRRGRLPASVLRAPGLILLVPGGLGLRSLESLYLKDALAGLEGLFSTALIGVALAGGILLANLIRPPRGAL